MAISNGAFWFLLLAHPNMENTVKVYASQTQCEDYGKAYTKRSYKWRPHDYRISFKRYQCIPQTPTYHRNIQLMFLTEI